MFANTLILCANGVEDLVVRGIDASDALDKIGFVKSNLRGRYGDAAESQAGEDDSTSNINSDSIEVKYLHIRALQARSI